MPRRRHRKKGGSQPQQSSYPDTENDSFYFIKKSDILGRYLTASRDLPEGTIIISEDAIVVGPSHDSLPVCLGCYSPIPDILTSYRCEKCQWPLCSNKCKGLFKRLGHSKEECETLVSCKVGSLEVPKTQLYNATVPLRCLLLKEHSPEQWDILLTMEAHNDIRRKMPSIWNYNQKSIVDRIRNEWKLVSYSEEEIHTICGILEVNSFAVGDESKHIQGIYPTSFFIAHACVPNTSHTDDEEYHMKIFTSIPISKDSMITLSYTTSLQSTRNRRAHLKQCKFFECDCVRCKDPTELGTYMSALKCHQCESGHMLAKDPLIDDTMWVCDNKRCHSTLPACDVDTLENRIDTEIKALNQDNIEDLENCIHRYSGILHQNHYHLLGMKYTLSHLYGKSVGFLIHQMTDTMLQRKKQLCEDLLKVFDVIEPGATRIRGLTMYELHAPIMILTIQRFETHKISKRDLSRRLKEVTFYLKECSRILSFEKKSSQEGCIKTMAEEALVQLKSWEPVVGNL